jgi:divergent AAA domain protein
MMNALMHRDFQTNMPVRLYQYNDRIEIMNPGGLYGKARPENFPTVNDYRNPIISEAMKVMGYVNKFNRGIDRVQRMLLDNGSPQAQFDVNKLTVFEVVVNECKAANSETTEQVTIPVTVPVTVPLTMPVEELLGVFQGEMSRTELMNILNLKNKAHFKTEYIRKALELGVIEMTQPDSPNSPTQKYRLTEKGKLLVK